MLRFELEGDEEVRVRGRKNCLVGVTEVTE